MTYMDPKLWVDQTWPQNALMPEGMQVIQLTGRIAPSSGGGKCRVHACVWKGASVDPAAGDEIHAVRRGALGE